MVYSQTNVEWNGRSKTRRPCLSERYRVHLNAARSYVVDLEPDGDNSRPPRLAATINADGGRILAMCRGRLTVDEIVKKLGYSCGSEEGSRIQAFLEGAAVAGHITWEGGAVFRPERQLTGSLEKYIPAHASIEVTNRCNMRCKYCYHGNLGEKVQPDEELQLEELISVLDDWQALGLLGVELTGGEPTISPKFIPLLRYSLNHFSLVAILTNGTNITDDFLALIGDTKCKVLVAFSLDAPEPKLFSQVTGTTARIFERVVDGIQRVNDLGVQTNVAMTVTHRNVDQVEAVADFLRELGVTGFSPALAAPLGNGFEDRWKWNMFLNKRFYEQFARVNRTYPGFVTNVRQVSDGKPRVPGMPEDRCDIGKRAAIMAPDGRVRACLMMPESWNVGSVQEHRIGDIILGDSFQYFATIPFPPVAACNGCVYELFCRDCAMTPFSVARKEGRLCGWWDDSGLAAWLRTHAQADEVNSWESAARFTTKTPIRECSQCPRFE